MFGNKLILSGKISFTGYKNFFKNEYVFQGNDGTGRISSSPEEFLTNFSRLEGRFSFTRENQGEYYILSKVILEPVILEPPLHLISFFSSMNLERESEPLYIEQR